MIVLQTVLLGAGMVLALYFFGFGVTRLVLPRALNAHARLLMPFFGMALVIVWDYIALWLGFNLTWATWGLVVFAVVLGVVVVVKGEISRSARNDKSIARNDLPAPRKDTAGIASLRQRASRLAMTMPRMTNPRMTLSLWVVVLAFVAFCAAVAPLWRYGFVTVIGENWDYEFYLPLADYLREMTTAQLVNAPPNPLLSTILSRHILPLPMGFSYLHATLNELLRMQALDTFPILMGVLHALGVVGAFLFFRAAFKMSERAALVATAFVAINGLLLWFTYWSFGLHLAALALLPVGLLLGVEALASPGAAHGNLGNGTRMNADERGFLGLSRIFRESPRAFTSKFVGLSWRSWLSAGLVLGALNVTYHPALIVAGLSLGAFGLWLLVTERGRIRVLVNGAAVVALTIVFSFPTLGQIDDFVREYYGRTPLAIGLREFVPFADGYGFSNQTLEKVVGQTISTPQLFAIAENVWEWSGTLLTLAAVGFSLFALWQLRRDTERRGVWYAMVAAAVIYVLVSRLPFLRPYPYGFLKSLSLVSYILIALTVQGIAFAWQWAKREQETGDWRLGTDDGRTLDDGRRTTDDGRRIVRYGVVAAVVFFGAISLFTFGITLEQYFKPAPMFFNADALRVRELEPLLESQATGRTSRPSVFLTDRAEVQGIPMGLVGYALRGEALYGNVSTGYGDLNNAAPNAVYDYALLARGEDPGARGYQPDALWQNEKFALYERESSILVNQLLQSRLVNEPSIVLNVDVNGVPTDASTIDPTPATRGVAFSILTFAPETIMLKNEGFEREVKLEPGITHVFFPQLDLPTQIVIEPIDQATLYLPSLQLRSPSEGELSATPLDATVVRCGQTKYGEGAECEVANPQGRELEWKWVARGTLKGSREDTEHVIASATGSPRTRVEFGTVLMTAIPPIEFDRRGPSRHRHLALPEGKWRGAIEIWDGKALLARIPIFRDWEVSRDATSTTMHGYSEPQGPPVILAR